MRRWDIFCRIVDNYGDIGVCWRLAKQLVHEHKLIVRLWVDDLEVAKRLISELDRGLESQTIAGIKICHWSEPFKETRAADVVIETFACKLPAAYLAVMVKTKPVWLNLEHLSVEPWTAESHLLPSPHPALPLTKHFFFPGFARNSGGLIREHDLIEKRDAFQRDSQTQAAFWKKLGLTGNPALKISLFCYPQAALTEFLKALAGGPCPTTVLVPDSSALTALSEQLGIGHLMVGDNISEGNLVLQVLPFLAQDDYDQLLWACDINFVRGEDSWVRALWAAKPLVWQPYWQTEDAHLSKLHAFLEYYRDGLPANAAAALHQMYTSWSNGQFNETGWQLFLNNLSILQTHAAQQSGKLASLPDLAAKLVIFCKNLSK